MPMHRLRVAVCSSLWLAAAAAAQRADLPGGTGHLAPGAEWTVLTAADLALAERPSDPKEEFAHTILRATVDTVRAKGRTADHVIVYSMGPRGALRLINCYHSDVRTTGAELHEPEVAESMRKALEPALAAEGVTVQYLGDDHPDLWGTGSLRLRFDVRAANVHHLLDYHAVPAGDALQFFEVLRMSDDADAEAAVGAVLRTFDGARDSRSRSLVNAAIASAVGGAIAGLVYWWMRRRGTNEVPGPEHAAR
jgi:uncharacterized MnhB-related membrane protein